MFGRKAIAISAAGRSDARPVLDAKSAGSGTDVADKKSDDAKVESAAKVDAALIVFGRDDKGKAHASRYDETDRVAAMKASHLMGFKALAVTKDAIRHIADELPQGRLFDSGKAFVPFVKEGRCLALEAHAKQFPDDVLELSANQIAEIEAEVTATKEDADTTREAIDQDDNDMPVKSDPPADWVDVEVGTTVLAVDDPDDGWWEAKVTHAHKSGIGTNTITMLTLEWVAYTDEPKFTRRANEVAYFPAGYGQTAPQAGSVGKAS